MTQSERPVPDAALADTVDARGMLCGQGIFHLVRAIARVPPTGIVKVLSTDRAAEHDYPAWCRNTGHKFLGRTTEVDERWGPVIVSYIQKRAGD